MKSYGGEILGTLASCLVSHISTTLSLIYIEQHAN